MSKDFNVISMIDIEARPVQWLWEPYIPRGCLTFLEGDPGLGKSWITLNLAAIISRGIYWPNEPDNILRPPGNTVLFSGEDDLHMSLRPRLDTLGADLSRIFVFDDESDFYLHDLDVLESILNEYEPELVVIDPIHQYINPKVDIFRANEVRPILKGVAKLAKKHNCAVLCVRHLTKGNSDKALYRGQGSIDFSAAARSVLLVGYDPNTKRRALCHIKSNLGEQGPTLSYVMANNCIDWRGTIAATGVELLASEPKTKKIEKSLAQLCAEAEAQLIQSHYNLEELKHTLGHSIAKTKQIASRLVADNILALNADKTIWRVVNHGQAISVRDNNVTNISTGAGGT